MSNTGTYGEGNPPQYGGPPTYVDPNAPPQYGAPPTYNQPPATNPNYAAPPPAAGFNQPNYAAPPASNLNQPNYAAPPSGGYVPPNQTGPSYAQPPPTGPSYAQPPPTGPSYAQPPPTGPSYAQPPSGGPSYANPPTTTTTVTHTTVNVQGQGGLRTDWHYGLCDIPCNKWCCYVFWCNACAIADLKASFDGSGGTWWVTVSILTLLYILSVGLLGVPAAYFVFQCLYNIAACVFLMQIANQLRAKLRIRESDFCCDCMQSWCCVPCRTCQLGRELEPISVPEVRELVLNLQRASPCNQACMHDHVIA